MQGTSLKGLVESLGAEGFYHKVCTLLNEQTLGVDDFSYYELAEACGVLPQLSRLRGWQPDGTPAPQLLRESNPGLSTNLFQVVTGELLARKVMEGYDDDSGFIGDQLVSVMTTKYRDRKIAGFRAL